MIIGLLYSWGNLCLDEKSADHFQKVLAGLRSIQFYSSQFINIP